MKNLCFAFIVSIALVLACRVETPVTPDPTAGIPEVDIAFSSTPFGVVRGIFQQSSATGLAKLWLIADSKAKAIQLDNTLKHFDLSKVDKTLMNLKVERYDKRPSGLYDYTGNPMFLEQDGIKVTETWKAIQGNIDIQIVKGTVDAPYECTMSIVFDKIVFLLPNGEKRKITHKEYKEVVVKTAFIYDLEPLR